MRGVHLRFATAIFTSSTLLFACQPLVARMIVPVFGGAAAVWIVCSVCFQALLLAGYGYAHVIGRSASLRVQVAAQIALVASAFVVMPIHVDDGWAQSLAVGHPTLGLLLILLRTIGLPFFVLSTTSPLLQRWFAELGEEDPYHLYAASNAGSMLALLGYPFLIEPLLAVRAQSRAMQMGFAGYAAVLLLCAVTALRRRAPTRLEAPASPDVEAAAGARARWRERLVWMALAFAPTSLLLGATQYITTDIASIPLLWLVPLALYLASFIVAFAKKQRIPDAVAARAYALVLVLLAVITLAQVAGPAWLVVGMHLLHLFLAALVCHRGLALRRPHASRLTEFYLLISLGGVLGGAFNGLLAPALLDDLYEYPLAIGLACLGRVAIEDVQPATGETRPATDRERRRAMARDVGLGVALGLVTLALVELRSALSVTAKAAFVVMFGAPLFVAFYWSRRPVRYGVAIAAILLAGMRNGGYFGGTIYVQRGFFGVLKVTHENTGRFRLLVVGRTMHGKEARASDRKGLPLAYYYATGPAGDVLGPLPTATTSLPARRVGAIGLGAGALSAYARRGDDFTFFEINPEVVTMARRHFTFLSSAEARAARIEIEIGDGRLRLRDGPASRFDVLVLDAFSSDAIPVHLVTREAFAVYHRTLRPGGLVLVHCSNEHLALAPVFAAVARTSNMRTLSWSDLVVGDEELEAGKDASEWLVMSDSREELDRIMAKEPRWKAIEGPSNAEVPPKAGRHSGSTTEVPPKAGRHSGSTTEVPPEAGRHSGSTTEVPPKAGRHSGSTTEVWTDDFANVLATMRF